LGENVLPNLVSLLTSLLDWRSIILQQKIGIVAVQSVNKKRMILNRET
jgi:hypothetical protein